MKERGEGRGERAGGGRKGEAAGLLPLVQADGTKSIMYKDVKRNGSEMPNGVRMNGEGGGGRGGKGGKGGTMDTRDGGKKDEDQERKREQWGESRRRKVRYAKLRGRAERLRSTLGRNEPCEKEELCTCALQCAK